ncbi:hypothetical protein KI387_034974, partial [Taxus chinensis]
CPCQHNSVTMFHRVMQGSFSIFNIYSGDRNERCSWPPKFAVFAQHPKDISCGMKGSQVRISNSTMVRSSFHYCKGCKRMGKLKLPITRIENPNAMQVCFYKRKMCILKKASELSILCGAEIGIIVYSLVGKEFTFGNLDIDFVVEKYQKIPRQKKKQTEKLKKERNKQVDSWWKRDIYNLELNQLVEFVDALKIFKEMIIEVVQKKESKKFNEKHPNEMEAAQMAQVEDLDQEVCEAYLCTRSLGPDSETSTNNLIPRLHVKSTLLLSFFHHSLHPEPPIKLWEVRLKQTILLAK